MRILMYFKIQSDQPRITRNALKKSKSQKILMMIQKINRKVDFLKAFRVILS